MRSPAALAMMFVASVILVPATHSHAQSCGNNAVESGEDCDPPGSLTCPDDSSPEGSFVACNSDCTCGGEQPGSSAAGSFLCYGIKSGGKGSESNVDLVDRYGSSTVDLEGPKRLCATTDVDDSDGDAADATDHLTEYKIVGRNSFQPVREQRMINQFGTLFFDVMKPTSLLVPASVGTDGDSADAPSTDALHYTCYAAKRSRNSDPFERQNDVAVSNAFEDTTIDVRRPRQVCVATDKNGENPGAENDPRSLVCYLIKGHGGLGKPKVSLDDQFGTHRVTLGQRQMLCVASQENPPTTTTTSPSTTTTSTSSTTTTTAPSTTSTTAPSSTTTTTIASTTTSTTIGSTTTSTTVPSTSTSTTVPSTSTSTTVPSTSTSTTVPSTSTTTTVPSTSTTTTAPSTSTSTTVPSTSTSTTVPSTSTSTTVPSTSTSTTIPPTTTTSTSSTTTTSIPSSPSAAFLAD